MKKDPEIRKHLLWISGFFYMTSDEFFVEMSTTLWYDCPGVRIEMQPGLRT